MDPKPQDLGGRPEASAPPPQLGRSNPSTEGPRPILGGGQRPVTRRLAAPQSSSTQHPSIAVLPFRVLDGAAD